MAVNIATILTCYNRIEKTKRCLESLFMAENAYNSACDAEKKIVLSIFLTDDACNDGTSDMVREVCKNHELHIINGNGKCYWAGGMRLAWSEALKEKDRWNFYLLLNDDIKMKSNVFEELFYTHNYSVSTLGKPGIYSGITCDIDNDKIITYSGDVFESNAKAKWRRLGPSEKPQIVHQTNANILLIAKEVVDNVGIFHQGYIHGCADYDYCMSVAKQGFTTLITAKVCGECEYDHIEDGLETKRLMQMPLKERMAYVYAPTHSDKDYLLFVKRNIPRKYLISWTLRKIRMFAPHLYYQICKARKIDTYT